MAPMLGPNPFVGPRPFEPGEPIFGRDREIKDLYYLLTADRIVVLHSPSGAGKSSLIQAGLIPRLQPTFDIWGPTRINLTPGAEGNHFVLSTILGFEEKIPEKLRRTPQSLAGQTLAEYFADRPRRRSAPPDTVLIFDQFEEILTVDPLAVAAKEEFFDQLGELLRNPNVWALFILREDYLAPLAPLRPAGADATAESTSYRPAQSGTGEAGDCGAGPHWRTPVPSRRTAVSGSLSR